MKYMALTLLALSASCLADQTSAPPGTPMPPPAKIPAPWFTGPLLTPSPNAVPVGHVNIEPYVFYGVTTSRYDSDWSTVDVPRFSQVRVQVPIQVGLTPWMDITVTPQGMYSWSQGASSARFTDLPVQFDIQIMHDHPGWGHPGMKFFIKETFPVGKYQHLNPDKFKTDISGTGSFATAVGFVIGKLFHFEGAHYLSTRFDVAYTYPAPVHVRGFNTYGGGYGTVGKVYPGNVFNCLLGLEFSMTRRWVLALDVASTLTTKTRFSGSPGTTTPTGTVITAATVGAVPSNPLGLSGTSDAITGGPASARFSLAPALEYNWNANLGVIAGAVFSVAGRNSVKYASGAFALNYYY